MEESNKQHAVDYWYNTGDVGKAIPTGIPVSGQGFSLALTQAGGYLAT